VNGLSRSFQDGVVACNREGKSKNNGHGRSH
jgi:hypothetical protein